MNADQALSFSALHRQAHLLGDVTRWWRHRRVGGSSVMHARRLTVCCIFNVVLVAFNVVLWTYQPPNGGHKPGSYSAD